MIADVVELQDDLRVEVMSATELATEVTPAGTETSEGEGRGTAEPTALVAGGAWI
jgi:hypothetical protein